MNYREARVFIEEINQKSGSVLGLERIRQLMHWLGDPQEQLHMIHVAGTNGKGSFGAFLASILTCAGLKVGRFVSPAVLDYREQIQVDGVWISEADVAACMEQIRDVCEAHCKVPEDYPTSFEMETAMAWLYFVVAQVDVVILEVGLGGEYDSTNIVTTPDLSVITSISYDHTAILGDTLEAIATQKAGIIKKGCPVLAYDQSAQVLEVLRNKAKMMNSDFYQTDHTCIKIEAQSLSGQTFGYKNYQHLHIAMAGDYQVQNAVLALEAAVCLRRQSPYDACLTDESICQGLARAKWEGRFEKISDRPLVIVDGAHNPDGAARLAESIAHHLKDYKIILVAGIFKDKDYDTILKNLSCVSDRIYTHQPPVARGLDAGVLAEAAGKYYTHVTVGESMEDAMTQAVHDAVSSLEPAAIVCFGSLSTILNLKNWLRNQSYVL